MTQISTYGPVQQDMPRVEEALRLVAEVSALGGPWLTELLKHVVDKGGKRIRPAITLLVGKPFNYDLDLLVPMATAVELLHTATLVHDDTIDKAILRRGNPTISSMWDGSTAVLLGDYLFANSAELVSRTQNVRAMRLFAIALMQICAGEMAQDFAAYNHNLTRKSYFKRIGEKTASLFSMAAETGSVLSGAPEEMVQALKEYAYNLGMAFQIADDILDFTGESSEMGKPVGSDLLQGTLTLPAILLAESRPQENPIQRLFDAPDRPDLLNQAIEMILDSPCIEQSYAVAEEFCAAARLSLAPVPAGEAKRTLEELTEYALERRW